VMSLHAAADVLGDAFADPLDVDPGPEGNDEWVDRHRATSAGRRPRRRDRQGLAELRARVRGQLEATDRRLRQVGGDHVSARVRRLMRSHRTERAEAAHELTAADPGRPEAGCPRLQRLAGNRRFRARHHAGCVADEQQRCVPTERADDDGGCQ